MNPGPAPTLLSDWVTPTGFGIIVAILLIAAVIVVIAENLHDHREDDQDEAAAYDDTCCIHTCTRPGLIPFNTPNGVLYACRQCAGIVGQWVGHDNRVYDQDLDPATDLAKWEKEMPA